MSRTLTIRLTASALRQVQLRARALRVTPSELVRRLLVEDVGTRDEEPTAFELTKRWVGSISDSGLPSGRDARTVLEAWRPDRRG